MNPHRLLLKQRLVFHPASLPGPTICSLPENYICVVDTMVVNMSSTSASVLPSSEDSEYLVDGLKAVSLKFVHKESDLNQAVGYRPEFVYQHFGDNETIFGYKNLEVTLYYTDASIYFLPEIKFDKEISSVRKDVKSDDIIGKLKAQLPSWQMETMVSSKEKFRLRLEEQKNFKPFGELLSKFDFEGREMQVLKVSKSSPAFNDYLARVQTLALWYIEAAQYTDNEDPRFNHYFVYEATKSMEGEGMQFSLAGYCSIVNFYCYPDMVRPRIAQILLLPNYRQAGNGAKFLQAVYNDLISIPNVKDITAEDPAESFIHLRDYVDCCNCAALPQFTPSNLKKGFSSEMREAALTKLKINPRQARRVYEILRLMHTNSMDPVEMKEYRIDVKRRLERPFKKSERDWKKVMRALDERELTSVTANQTNLDQKMHTLQQLYESEIEDYRGTINRLKTFSKIPFM